MNTHKNTIRTLEKIRDEYHSQLDISVITELNTVIADLKVVNDSKKNETQLFIEGLRTLQVICIVISLVSNIKDLMK